MIASRLPRLLFLVALAAMVACGSPEPSAQPAPSSANPAATDQADGVTVDVAAIAYTPAEVRVLPGTEITWINGDAGVAHTVTSGTGGSNAVAGVSDGEQSKPDGTFDGELPPEGSFSFTFNQSGTFTYFCAVHPSMRAAVIVE